MIGKIGGLATTQPTFHKMILLVICGIQTLALDSINKTNRYVQFTIFRLS